MSNTIVREVSPNTLFPDASGMQTSSLTYAQGDVLVMDTTNHVLAVPTLETQGNLFLGIAQVAVNSGKVVGPYQGLATSSAAALGYGIPGPIFGVVAKMTSKTAEAWVIGGSVYLDPGTGGNGVAATGTKAIGIYVGQVGIASATAGQMIEVLVGCRYPNDVLKF